MDLFIEKLHNNSISCFSNAQWGSYIQKFILLDSGIKRVESEKQGEKKFKLLWLCAVW